jgi:thymidylate kinase
MIRTPAERVVGQEATGGGVAPSEIPQRLIDLFGALDRAGVRWSLLRPRETLGLPEGDVDILVDPSGHRALGTAFGGHGFIRVPMAGPDVHAVTYDEDARRFVWVHAQEELRIAGASLPAEIVLLDADTQGLREPAGDCLLWILLLRALVDKGELPERHRPHVQALARRWSFGPGSLVLLARRHGLEPARVVAAAAEGDWQALLALSVHRPPAPPPWPARIIGAAGRLRRVLERRGMSVAVLGPDGAGKSTLVESLARRLPWPIRVQYMGLTGGRMPQADALRVPGLVFVARVLLLWARYARGLYHRAGGGIVLFERYTLDGAVPSGMPLSRAGRLSRRLQRRVCPIPDLVLVLDAPGETLYARSGEYRPEILESWRVAFRRLEAEVPQLEIIDAEQSTEAVEREAERRIWRRYAELRAGRSGETSSNR